jgi:ribonuclease Z
MVNPMDITFMGTGSAQPSATRNHQAMALRVNGEVWLFDCGEATQHQFQKSNLRMGKITRVFITHMHGDHCFGLAPLMCSMSDNLNPGNSVNKEDQEDQIIEVYGPSPLRHWLRTNLKSTYSHLGKKYRVHELLYEHDPRDLNEDLHHNELPGENIEVRDGHFDLPFCLEGYKVLAAPIQHSIPSLGYVIKEHDWPGTLDTKVLMPLIKKNQEALKQQGIKNPMSLLGQLQRTNKPIELPDGSSLVPPPTRPGRQVVILGDTSDPSSLIPLVESPHLLVHEATNALTRLDSLNLKEGVSPPTFEEVEERAKDHGHSTPQMAGKFAKQIGCKKLILTHFSARYRGDEEPESLEIMEEIRKLALNEFDQREEDIYCARDLWSFEIPF